MNAIKSFANNAFGFVKNNVLIISIVVIFVIAIAIVLHYLWFNPNPKGCENYGQPGSCSLNSDCNYPNGTCNKDSQNNCTCTCAEGFFGTDCATKGVPWNSGNCMGPNTQFNGPARKGDNGQCVCPPGSWVSGTDSKYGFVQCFGCGETYGPYSGDKMCTLEWGNFDISTQNCYTIEHAKAQDPCQYEYNNIFTAEIGPGNTRGSVQAMRTCSSGESCHCGANLPGATQIVCGALGWVDPTVTYPKCDSNERPCPSYQCNPGSTTINGGTHEKPSRNKIAQSYNKNSQHPTLIKPVH